VDARCRGLFLARRKPEAGRGTGVTVFEGARLIVGDGSAPIEQSAFIIGNNKFAGVGKKGELQVPAGATRVDLTGKTVMPAMVDIHSHLGFLKQSDGSMSKENFNRENILDHLNRYAYHGFAAVISSGTDSSARSPKARAPTSSSSTRTRWTTCRISAGSRTSI
jgi:imidazolonepropionase-like amidohydrolase